MEGESNSGMGSSLWTRMAKDLKGSASILLTSKDGESLWTKAKSRGNTHSGGSRKGSTSDHAKADTLQRKALKKKNNKERKKKAQERKAQKLTTTKQKQKAQRDQRRTEEEAAKGDMDLSIPGTPSRTERKEQKETPGNDLQPPMCTTQGRAESQNSQEDAIRESLQGPPRERQSGEQQKRTPRMDWAGNEDDTGTKRMHLHDPGRRDGMEMPVLQIGLAPAIPLARNVKQDSTPE